MFIRSIWLEQKRLALFKLAWRLNFTGEYMQINNVYFREAIIVADYAIATSPYWADSKPSEYAAWLSKNMNQKKFEDWKNVSNNG